MLFTTSIGARLLGMSTSHFGRLMKRLDVKPVSRRMGDGRPESLWSKCQLWSLMVAGCLVRAANVSGDWADAFVATMTTSYSDESLEAELVVAKRAYVVVAGGRVVPALFTLEEGSELLKENATVLAYIVSVAPLFLRLIDAVRSCRGEEKFA